MSNWFKRNGVHLIIVAILVAISFSYFLTPVMQGKALIQNDVIQAQAMQKEIMDVKAKTGHAPLWTNGMFGGMPSYQLWMSYPANITTYVISGLKAIFPNPVDTVLLYLLGAYLLFSVLKLNPWLAAAGAIAFGFSSYNFIYIEAGHANQAYAIAFFAPILAGVILLMRGKNLLGASLTALFLALEIRSNHIQMTYYFLLALLIFIVIELYHAIKTKQLKPFGKSIGYLAVATLLALAVNAATLWTTYEYSHETIRGKSNLTQNAAKGTGLDKDYAYNWSQGVAECFTFLIPNAYGGGSSTELSADSKVVKALTDKGIDAAQAQGFAQRLPIYWGNKPSTYGPWYFGAAVCFLFILGLLIVKDRIKWWLLSAVLLSMLLSFGKNLPFLSDLFFNYFPLYNKFRAVESILVIASLCFPILAFLAVNEVVTSTDKAFIFKKLKLAAYITGGLTLIMIAVPSIFLSFQSPDSQNLLSGLTQAFRGDNALANTVVNGLIQDRTELERNDAIRSLIFIALAFGILWAFVKQKINVTVLSAAFIVITLIDLWGINKRYLKDENFVEKEDILQQAYKPREVDQFILRDTDPDFRVMDLSLADPFHDATASYFYKTVGGFHSARLRRFDELIENQFTKSVNHDVLDMLNAKYIITADPKTQAVSMQVNQTACGHAWFVKSVKYADNSDQEMQAISSFSPKDEAIVDKEYSKLLDTTQLKRLDPSASIKLVSYDPEHLVYQSGSTSSQIAVFSEIYYNKGWTMLIDGKESPYFRADYLLRAAQLPVGNHKIEFIFHPTSYYAGEDISLAGSILLVLALGYAGYAETKKKSVAKKA